MPADLPEPRFLVGDEAALAALPEQRPLAPFDPRITALLADLSARLRGDREASGFADLVTLAFFCRRANLAALARQHEPLRHHSLGRGVSFHVAPANVALNFAYSLVAGLLSGNACVVRISDREFAQVELLCRALGELLAQPVHAPLRGRIVLVRYPHDHALNARLSALCDVRLIWGGDDTIAAIRRAPLRAGAFDLTFADRYAACVIDAAAYLAADDKPGLAGKFYNDTYLFDQNACSSPRLVVWLGDAPTAAQARAQFWPELARQLELKGYHHDGVTAVDKYSALCRAAVALDGATREDEIDPRILRVRLGALSPALPDHACAGGLFYEYIDADLAALTRVITPRYQTLTYFGLDAQRLRDQLVAEGVPGVDRIVPIGDAASFALIWDGYDLIAHLSRRIDAR